MQKRKKKSWINEDITPMEAVRHAPKKTNAPKTAPVQREMKKKSTRNSDPESSSGSISGLGYESDSDPSSSSLPDQPTVRSEKGQKRKRHTVPVTGKKERKREGEMGNKRPKTVQNDVLGSGEAITEEKVDRYEGLIRCSSHGYGLICLPSELKEEPF